MSGFCFVRIINNACYLCSTEAVHKLKLTTFFSLRFSLHVLCRTLDGSSQSEKCAIHTISETQTFRQWNFLIFENTSFGAHVRSRATDRHRMHAEEQTNNTWKNWEKPRSFASFHYDRSMVLVQPKFEPRPIRVVIPDSSTGLVLLRFHATAAVGHQNRSSIDYANLFWFCLCVGLCFCLGLPLSESIFAFRISNLIFFRWKHKKHLHQRSHVMWNCILRNCVMQANRKFAGSC